MDNRAEIERLDFELDLASAAGNEERCAAIIKERKKLLDAGLAESLAEAKAERAAELGPNAIEIVFKTSDAIHQALMDAGIDPRSEKADEVRRLASKWIKWGEFVTVIVDMKKKTATVEEQK